MKVIGMQDTGYKPTYICTINHGELEKFLNAYYNGEKLKELKVGDELDLGRGYNFAAEITKAMETTRKFVQDNQAVVSAIMQGMSIEALVRAADTAKPATETSNSQEK